MNVCQKKELLIEEIRTGKNDKSLILKDSETRTYNSYNKDNYIPWK